MFGIWTSKEVRLEHWDILPATTAGNVMVPHDALKIKPKQNHSHGIAIYFV